MALDVEVGGINVCSRCTKIRIERQRLIELARQMQIDILGQTAVVGIKVLVVPLIAAVQRAVTILPRVVAAHGHHILTSLDIGGEIEAEGHHTIVGEAHFLAIHPHIGTLTGAFELNKHLACHLFGSKGEVLAIPADGVCQIDNIQLESLIAIEGIRQCDRLPRSVVEIGIDGCGEVAHL